MKRNGYVMILVLIVSAVCITTVIFACESIYIQSRLLSNRIDNVQAGLLLESEILKYIIDEEDSVFDKMDEIIKRDLNFHIKEYTLTIPSDKLDSVSAKLLFEKCDDGRITFNLNLNGRLSSVSDSITAKGHVYNGLVDHCKDGLITLDGMSLEESDNLDSLLESVKNGFDKDEVTNNYFTSHNYLENLVEVKAKSTGTSKLYFHREGFSTSHNIQSGRMVLVKEYDCFNRDIVRIEKSAGSYGDGMVKGIIYLENGDLVLSGDLYILGIIILENGNIIKEGDGNIKIHGKLIMNNHNSLPEGVQLSYNEDNFRQHARFLPGFISPGIDFIR